MGDAEVVSESKAAPTLSGIIGGSDVHGYVILHFQDGNLRAQVCSDPLAASRIVRELGASVVCAFHANDVHIPGSDGGKRRAVRV